MESYIIRIYQRGSNSPATVVGTVEDVTAKEVFAFRSTQELEQVLKLVSDESAHHKTKK